MLNGPCVEKTNDPNQDIVIADAGPLIHLDELDCIDLLYDFKHVLVPDAVWREVLYHRPQSLHRPNSVLTRKSVPESAPLIDTLTPMFMLHAGEREALILCLQYSGCILLTDDTAVRLAAKAVNVQTHGTIGVLIRSVRRHLRTKTEVLTLMSSIPQRSTLHIRPAFLADVIREIEEMV